MWSMASVARVAVLCTLGAGLLAAAGAACSDPYEDGSPPSTGDAALDAPRDDGAGKTDPCVRAVPPAAPDTDDAPDVTLPTFALAMTDDIFATDVVTGFDLDGVCTCDAREGAARAGAPSCARNAGPACDFDGGIDNATLGIGAGFAGFGLLVSLPQSVVRLGRGTGILQIAGYNGQANDPRVTVAYLSSDGIQEPRCPGSVQDVGSSMWSPGYCGDDVWSVRPEAVFGSSSNVPTVAGVGFVRDHVLVVRLSGPVALPFSEAARYVVPDALVTGTLVKITQADLSPQGADAGPAPADRDARLWLLQGGLVSGRMPAPSLLATVGQVRVTGSDGTLQSLCQQPSFPPIASAICAAVDVAAAPPLDFSPGASCDALSTHVSFRAKPALLGAVYARDRATTPCDVGAFDYRCP